MFVYFSETRFQSSRCGGFSQGVGWMHELGSGLRGSGSYLDLRHCVLLCIAYCVLCIAYCCLTYLVLLEPQSLYYAVIVLHCITLCIVVAAVITDFTEDIRLHHSSADR